MKIQLLLRFLPMLLALSVFTSCQPFAPELQIHIQNGSDLDRVSEIVSLPLDELSELTEQFDPQDLLFLDQSSGDTLVRQLLDLDQDGKTDEILLQVEIAAQAEKTIQIIGVENGRALQPAPGSTTYSRFVPERTDDYTWENDRVAFRTYGPEAQRLVEQNEPGGTLSSGIDLWLKRVNYSIIDDWYTKNLDSIGYYHIDHGEGYDPYHVGKSRGTGGIGVWESDSLHVSRNFTAYRTIATGPLRTVFELDYAPWSKYGIRETKRISLDLGSNFSRFEISLTPQSSPPNYTLGITLHEGGGTTRLEPEAGWVRHWEMIDDSHVGEGLVLDPASIVRAFVHASETPDQSQLLVITDPGQTKLVYYAGFAWDKSGQVSSVEDWDQVLAEQAARLRHPLTVSVKK